MSQGQRKGGKARPRVHSDRSAPSLGPSGEQPNKLFIGGLSYDTTDESLEAYFKEYGTVSSAVVLRDPTTQRSRGFGFVTFESLKSASRAVAYSHHLIDGRKVEAKFAVPRVQHSSSTSAQAAAGATAAGAAQGAAPPLTPTTSPRSPSRSPRSGSKRQSASPSSSPRTRPESEVSSDLDVTPFATSDGKPRENSLSGSSSGSNGVSGLASPLGSAEPIISNKIFVGGLPYATGHDSLRVFFEAFGAVESAEVIYNRETRKSRGFGFVVFRSARAADAVLAQQQRNGLLVLDGKQVEVKRCVPRQDPPAGCSSSSSNNNNNDHQQHTGWIAAPPAADPLTRRRAVSSTPPSPPAVPPSHANTSGHGCILQHALSFDGVSLDDDGHVMPSPQQLRALHASAHEASLWQQQHHHHNQYQQQQQYEQQGFQHAGPRRTVSVGGMLPPPSGALAARRSTQAPAQDHLWSQYHPQHGAASAPHQMFPRSHSMGPSFPLTARAANERADSGSTCSGGGGAVALDLDGLGSGTVDAFSGLGLDDDLHHQQQEQPRVAQYSYHQQQRTHVASPLSARSAPVQGFSFFAASDDEPLDPPMFAPPPTQEQQAQRQQEAARQLHYHQQQQQQQQQSYTPQGYGFFGPVIPE